MSKNQLEVPRPDSGLSSDILLSIPSSPLSKSRNFLFPSSPSDKSLSRCVKISLQVIIILLLLTHIFSCCMYRTTQEAPEKEVSSENCSFKCSNRFPTPPLVVVFVKSLGEWMVDEENAPNLWQLKNNPKNMFTSVFPSFPTTAENGWKSVFWDKEDQNWIWNSALANGIRPAFYGHYDDFQSENDFLREPHLDFRSIESISKMLNTGKGLIIVRLNSVHKAARYHDIHSQRVNDAIRNVDEIVSSLIADLKEKDLWCCTNLLVTSDSGLEQIHEVHHFEELTGLTLNSTDENIIKFSISDEEYQNFSKKIECSKDVRVFNQGTVPLRFDMKLKENERILLPNQGVLIVPKRKRRPDLTGQTGDPARKSLHSFLLATGPSFLTQNISKEINQKVVIDILKRALGFEGWTPRARGSPNFLEQFENDRYVMATRSGHVVIYTSHTQLFLVGLFDVKKENFHKMVHQSVGEISNFTLKITNILLEKQGKKDEILTLGVIRNPPFTKNISHVYLISNNGSFAFPNIAKDDNCLTFDRFIDDHRIELKQLECIAGIDFV